MEPSWPGYVSAIIDILSEFISTGIHRIVANPASFTLPPVQPQLAIDMCRGVQTIFETEANLVQLQGDFVVVGDLHGSILDLIRLLVQFGFPPTTKYVILGDFVDKGQFSVHTAVYLLALKCRFPRSFYLIRGNHEFDEVNRIFGLFAEIREDFQTTDLHTALNNAFAHMPIAIRLNGDILCVHGGIGPDFVSLSQLADISKPIRAFGNPIIDAVMWSDPLDGVVFQRNTKRNKGFVFGEEALADFLARNKLRMVIRGHSYTAEGVKFQFASRLVTVFSASNYTDAGSGFCGALQVKEGQPIAVHRLVSMPMVYRHPAKNVKGFSQKPPMLPRPGGLDISPKKPDAKAPPIIVIRSVRGRHSMK
jgi:diadenosine tetraphosphatase ApaH/serine/threonine PP2A family protein phosphatase